MVTVANMLPLHRGQTASLDDQGNVVIDGDVPKTDRLGVSWNAFHNRFWSTKKIAEDEWNALFSKHPDEADLKRRQFAWALPAEPEEFELMPLTIAILSNRVRDLPRDL